MLVADCVPEIENKKKRKQFNRPFFFAFLMCPCKGTIKLSSETNYNTDKLSMFVDPTDVTEP